MIDKAAALCVAREHLARYRTGHCELALAEDRVLERPFGWIFFYNSRQFLETGDDRHALLGNAPFIVDRRDGSVHATGTGRPLQHYIERYERERPPDPAPSPAPG